MSIPQWKRLFAMIGALRHPKTVNEITAETGVCSKTVRRELVALQKLGFDLRFTVDTYGIKIWRIVDPLTTLKALIEPREENATK